jgi:hypothetical protein
MRRGWVGILLVSVACADEIPEDVSEQMEAARAATQQGADSVSGPSLDELLVTAPAGGHADWVRDISSGLDSVTAKAAIDRGEALHAVQELYSRRFEPLRLFYGTDGAAKPGPQLAQTVENAGTRLQELMRYLAGNEADAGMIEEAVRATQDALDRVEMEARSAGLPPSAPRDTAIGGQQPAPEDTATTAN